MKMSRAFLILMIYMVMGLPVQARDFRTIQPISKPGALPVGAEAITELRPVPRDQVEAAVQAVARAWNGGELDSLLAESFANKTRLLDTIAEVVPRDARLTVLGVQAVSTLGQYLLEGKVISTVSAVVRSQIEFNDPVTGFQRLEGTGEWYFQVEERESQRPLLADIASLRVAAESLHLEQVAELNAALSASASTDELPTITPPPGLFDETVPEELLTADVFAGDRDADTPVIDEVVPAAPQWDSLITLRGINFGETAGSLQLVTRDPRGALPLRIVTWTDRAVSVLIHEDVHPLLTYTYAEPAAVVIWLETAAGDRTGVEVFMQPSPTYHSPVITDVVSGDSVESDPPTWTPGQTLLLTGRHFLSDPGAAVFQVGGRTIAAEINSWSDTRIEVTLPADIEGLVGQDGILSVSSNLGWDGETPLTFVPRIATDLIEGAFSIDCDGSHDFVALDYPLANGWVVGMIEPSFPYVSYDYDFVEDSSPGAWWFTPTCSIYRETWPEWGTSNPGTQVYCRCSPGGVSASGRVWVYIHGPAGTFHGHVSAR